MKQTFKKIVFGILAFQMLSMSLPAQASNFDAVLTHGPDYPESTDSTKPIYVGDTFTEAIILKNNTGQAMSSAFVNLKGVDTGLLQFQPNSVEVHYFPYDPSTPAIAQADSSNIVDTQSNDLFYSTLTSVSTTCSMASSCNGDGVQLTDFGPNDAYVILFNYTAKAVGSVTPQVHFGGSGISTIGDRDSIRISSRGAGGGTGGGGTGGTGGTGTGGSGTGGLGGTGTGGLGGTQPGDAVGGPCGNTNIPAGIANLFTFGNFCSVNDVLVWAIKFLLSIVAMLAVLFIIYGGFQYIMSAQSGGEKAALVGKKTITNAIIGLIISILAYSMINIVLSSLKGNVLTSTNPTNPINQRPTNNCGNFTNPTDISFASAEKNITVSSGGTIEQDIIAANHQNVPIKNAYISYGVRRGSGDSSYISYQYGTLTMNGGTLQDSNFTAGLMTNQGLSVGDIPACGSVEIKFNVTAMKAGKIVTETFLKGSNISQIGDPDPITIQ